MRLGTDALPYNLDSMISASVISVTSLCNL